MLRLPAFCAAGQLYIPYAHTDTRSRVQEYRLTSHHKRSYTSNGASRHCGGAGRHMRIEPLQRLITRAHPSPRFLVTTPIHEGPVSRELGHVSSALAHMFACEYADRRLAVTRSVRHGALACSPLRRQAARLLHVFARHHPIHPAICCHSRRGYGAWRRLVHATAAARCVVAWRGGSQGFCRYSYLAALLGAERPVGA